MSNQKQLPGLVPTEWLKPDAVVPVTSQAVDCLLRAVKAAVASVPFAGAPVAFMWQHEETGRIGFIEADQDMAIFERNNPCLKIVAPLYTAPAVEDAAVPDGWKLVREALQAARHAIEITGQYHGVPLEGGKSYEEIDELLSAALAAAPTPPAAQAGEEVTPVAEVAACTHGNGCSMLGWFIDPNTLPIGTKLYTQPAATAGAEGELIALHSKLAAETLRADQGWERYEAANAARNRAEAELADLRAAQVGEEVMPNVDAIMSALYRRFKEWSKRGFGPDDVTWCEVKADVLSLIATQPAAIRSAGLADGMTDAIESDMILAIQSLEELQSGEVSKATDHLIKKVGTRKPTITDALRKLEYALPMIKRYLHAAQGRGAASPTAPEVRREALEEAERALRTRAKGHSNETLALEADMCGEVIRGLMQSTPAPAQEGGDA